MRRCIIALLALGLLLTVSKSQAKRYVHKLCNTPNFECIKAPRSGSWQSLFKDKGTMIQKLNRVSRRHVSRGMTIAVPKNYAELDMLDVAPFPKRVPNTGEKIFVFDPALLAWAAYSDQGHLVKWGPAVGGKNWCPDDRSACRTAVGKFRVYSRRGARCISYTYPRPRGGAPMPYCVFFHRGFSVHAGPLPGHHDSHGCVRTLKTDARWLDQKFFDIGTPVHVRPYGT